MAKDSNPAVQIHAARSRCVGRLTRKANAQEFQPRKVVRPENVVGGDVVLRAELHRDVLEFSLESAKQFVPNHQRPAKIPIHIWRILAVVNPVGGVTMKCSRMPDRFTRPLWL